jgi:hypothetical protein
MGAVDSRQFTVCSKNLWLVRIKNTLTVSCRLSAVDFPASWYTQAKW